MSRDPKFKTKRKPACDAEQQHTPRCPTYSWRDLRPCLLYSRIKSLCHTMTHFIAGGALGVRVTEVRIERSSILEEEARVSRANRPCLFLSARGLDRLQKVRTAVLLPAKATTADSLSRPVTLTPSDPVYSGGGMKGCRSKLQGISKASRPVQKAYATTSQVRCHCE